jgi:serine phosphatase RsbU (regulator of sigma subunit)
VAESLERLARLVVPALADWVIIDLADARGLPVQVAMFHRDGHEEDIRRFAELQPRAMTPEAPIRRVLAGSGPILHSDTGTAGTGGYVTDPELLALCERFGIVSVMYVPMTVGERVVGSIALVSGSSGRHFGEADLRVATHLGRRAAVIVENARRYEHEHLVAEALQQSLLPDLPDPPGLRLAARYLPSDDRMKVGGDFYEALPLPGGRIGLAVGDVVGHDVRAAAAMGQLRSLVRAFAWESATDRGGDPGEVLDRVDRVVTALGIAALASVWFATVGPPGPGGNRTLHWSSAGHPPPLLRLPDGRVRVLDDRVAAGTVLGVDGAAARRTAATDVPPGSVLVAYTDGLSERRGEHPDVGTDRLVRALAAAPRHGGPGVVADGLTRLVAPERGDDIAVLVVDFSGG